MNINQSTSINSFSQYSSYTAKYHAQSRVTVTEGGMQAGKTGNNKSVQLSDAAKEYLETLRTKYSKMDITVANFSSHEEADSIANKSGGTKDYWLVIDPETLEEMATDEAARLKYESIIDKSASSFDSIKSEFNKEELKEINSIGLSVDKEGNVNYIVRMRQGNVELMESHRRSAEERRAEQKERAEKEERLGGGRRKPDHARPEGDEITISASSIEEIVEKVKAQLAENNRALLQTNEEKALGQTIDFKA